MLLLLSGEGKTDLGQMTQGPNGAAFAPGPMAWIVDKLLAEHPKVKFSLLESQEAGADFVHYVHETELARSGRKGPTLLAGIKHGKGNAFFTRNAQCLGLKAIDLMAETQRPVLAVLFRDADDAASGSSWKAKFESIAIGFKQVEFLCGVPMVPRPKSEAWLLCALQKKYQACEALEDASGNDDSPHSLKKQLAAWVGHEPSAEEQANWVRENRVDPARIQMPSFRCFVEALEVALAQF